MYNRLLIHNRVENTHLEPGCEGYRAHRGRECQCLVPRLVHPPYHHGNQGQELLQAYEEVDARVHAEEEAQEEVDEAVASTVQVHELVREVCRKTTCPHLSRVIVRY